MQYVVSEPEQQAQFVVIWMPGLGAGYEDMAGLAQAISILNVPVRHIFLQAPDRPVTLNGGMKMPAWYDIYGDDLASRQDYQGVKDSSELIEKVIVDQINQGMNPHQIFLSGFSQGGAMALYTGLRLDMTLGGLVALSAYVPCDDKLNVQLDTSTPVFMGYGELDSMVLPQWTKLSHEFIQNQGFQNTTLKSYMMEHSVNEEEIMDLHHWFNEQMAGGSK